MVITDEKPSDKMELIHVNKEAALFNLDWMEGAIKPTLEQFKTPPNSLNTSSKNDDDEELFKLFFTIFFGRISLRLFLKERICCVHSANAIFKFRSWCDFLQSDLSYDEVEVAYNNLVRLRDFIQQA